MTKELTIEDFRIGQTVWHKDEDGDFAECFVRGLNYSGSVTMWSVTSGFFSISNYDELSLEKPKPKKKVTLYRYWYIEPDDKLNTLTSTRSFEWHLVTIDTKLLETEILAEKEFDI